MQRPCYLDCKRSVECRRWTMLSVRETVLGPLPEWSRWVDSDYFTRPLIGRVIDDGRKRDVQVCR